MRYVAIDFETTGLDPATDQIIEIAAARFSLENTESEDFQTLVKPTVAISRGAQRLHKLKARDLAEAPPIETAWANFIEWLGDDRALIAHNAGFEAKFIRPLYKGTDFPPFTMIDTLEIAKKRMKGMSGYALSDLVEIEGKAHRALPDARACRALFIALCKTYKSGKVPLKTYGKTVMELAPKGATTPSRKSKAGKPSDPPTRRQLNYIESLGGNPQKPRTKKAASKYIDSLKSGEDESPSFIWRFLWGTIQVVATFWFLGWLGLFG